MVHFQLYVYTILPCKNVLLYNVRKISALTSLIFFIRRVSPADVSVNVGSDNDEVWRLF